MKNQKLCSGIGQYHTDKRGLSYETITLAQIVAVIEAPTSSAKEAAQWFIPSNLLTREAKKQRENGAYYATWCDFDKHTTLDAIKEVLADLCCEYAVYSSRSATIEHQKWRVIIPLAEPANATQWQQVSEIINDKFQAANIEPDRASERVNQICYLPNKGEFYEFCIEQNHAPLNWSESFKTELLEKEKQAISEKQRIEELQKQSRIKAEIRMNSGTTSPMDAFNAAYSVEQSLEFYGYKRVGNKWISPNSESGTAGVIVKDNKWISSHASDLGIGRQNANGTSGDAFDLFKYYQCGNVRSVALKAAGDMFTTDSGKTINQQNQQNYKENQASSIDDFGACDAHFSQTDSDTAPPIPQWKIELNERIEKLNQNYAVVLDGTKALVMKTTVGTDGRNKRAFLSTESFTKLHMNKILMVGVNSRYGTPIYENEAVAWLKHWNRKQYTDGIVFEPSQYPNGIEEPATIAGEMLNLWQGYSIEPKQHGGALERIYSHIQDVICSGDIECNEYLLNWISRCFQYPNKNGQVAVALKGEKGCGKSTLGKFIKSIFGQYALQVTTPKHLIGNFNAHMADCCFLFADEVFFAGDKAHENILKGLITEPNLMIERKGVDALEMPNRIKLLMASNNDWIAPASKDERRYFVLDVSNKKIGDTGYFNALHREIDNTDIQAAFLYEMLHRDISAFNVGKIPDTKALQHQRAQSLDSFGKYWLDVLQRGVIFETQHNMPELKYWTEKPAVDLIRAGYEQWINKNKIQQFGIVSRETMGRHLVSWYGAKQRQFMTLIIGESSKGELLTSGARPYLYAVGTQREAIEAFCKAEKLDATDLLKSID
jgi:hypothetical protein